MDDPPKPPLLNYVSVSATHHRPSRRVAFLFCLPGSTCWFLILMGFFSNSIWIPWPLFITLVDIAVATAIISFLYYALHWRHLQAWYVILCLCINGAGLAFLALISIHPPFI